MLLSQVVTQHDLVLYIGQCHTVTREYGKIF